MSGIPHSVTVGIVAYNTAIPVLKETLMSLRLHGEPAVTLLCNSESPLYRKEIENLAESGLMKKLIFSENKGFGQGHNKILETVMTDFYVCCNPDITLTQHAIENLADAAHRLPDGVLFCPKVLNLDDTIQMVARRHLNLPDLVLRQLWRLLPQFFTPYESGFDYELEQPIEFVSGCFFLIKTRDFKKLDGFSREFFLYCEDADLSKRANLIGKNYYIPSARVFHRWNKGWSKSPRHFWTQLIAAFKYFRIHGFF